MNKIFLIIIAGMLAALIVPGFVLAGPDQFVGDTELYGGVPTVVEPNVLIIIDDSGSMSDTVPGGPFVSSATYTVQSKCTIGGHTNQPCATNDVFSSSSGYADELNTGLTVNNVTTSCGGANPQNLLLTTGIYYGTKLNTNGTCKNSGSATYWSGNYVNYNLTTGAPTPKINVAIDVVQNLVQSTTGVHFGLMTYNYAHTDDGSGGTFLAGNAHGLPAWASTYVSTVSDLTTTLPDGIHHNVDAFIQVLNTLTPTGSTPLGEALFEAMRYYEGGKPAFGATIGVSSSGTYSSPIVYGCQKNYVILVTDGMANTDSASILGTAELNTNGCKHGACGSDLTNGSGGGPSVPWTNWPYVPGVDDPANTCGNEGMPGPYNHVLSSVAWYMYNTDLISDISGTQNVMTYTVGFDANFGSCTPAVNLLAEAADNNHGHGNSFLATSESALSQAFASVISEIFSVNSSFVAPVVPVSPENRTYSGNMIYMGFFLPGDNQFWGGNLKKFGLDANNNIIDSVGHLATYETTTNPQRDSRDDAVVPQGDTNGSFRNSSISYWSIAPDGGNVEEGGVGDALLNRSTARNIYTYLGASSNLTVAANAFISTNVTPTMLGFVAGDTTDSNNLINFIYGQDAYNSSGTGNTTALRPWIMGDVLHSKPQVFSYMTYSPSAANDANCSVNTSMIYVGADDGMMHAFKDCDGSEAWAFVPPDLFSVLQYMQPTGNAHTYYVDFSPVLYVYNKLQDGNINPANGDKVVLLFGLRRGGGLNTGPTAGYYYAIDVTTPLNPQFLWKISKSTTGFSELAESWSDITVGKVNLATGAEIVAFVGAGYDNCNEDARYGSLQGYPGACVAPPVPDSGNVTSVNSGGSVTPKGRGLYVIEIATLNSNGAPILASSGSLVWSYTYANSSTMNFSIPGQILAVDTNFDGYIELLYAGDTGGNVWRFWVGSPSTSNWSATKIFSSNPGYSAATGQWIPPNTNDGSNGRKIFYAPVALVQQNGTIGLYFGTGDREHPLNTNVVDRIYGLIDRGQTTSTGVNESNMVDVTEDILQSPTVTSSTIASILSSLSSTSEYGWYIRLNQNAGEKVLAPATVFNQDAIYTTYSPLTVANPDPCVTGNLGTARAYDLNYATGEAVQDFDLTNDSTTTTNTRALLSSATGNVYIGRSDRVETIGSGIPSGAVIVTSQSGLTTAMVGVGGNIQTLQLGTGLVTSPLYWRLAPEYQQAPEP